MAPALKSLVLPKAFLQNIFKGLGAWGWRLQSLWSACAPFSNYLMVRHQGGITGVIRTPGGLGLCAQGPQVVNIFNLAEEGFHICKTTQEICIK